MKRIEAFFSDKVDSLKRSIRMRKVNSALDNAKLNFEEDKRTAELKMEEFAIKLTDADSVDEILKELFECQATIEKCNIGIKRVNDIREYFDAEVE
jgi:hypothetical protein